MTLTPAWESKTGTDMSGNQTATDHPFRLRLRMGPNVREVVENGIYYYYATADGRVRWASETIAVDTVLTITGDVGQETGNICHPGALIIQGDVRAGSRIEASGDIDIHGSVESADIRTGGNLSVDFGIGGGVRTKNKGGWKRSRKVPRRGSH